MKKLLLAISLLSLQAAVNATEGSCCSSCPEPKVEAKKKRGRKKKVVAPVQAEEATEENVVEAEVEVVAEEEVTPEAEEVA